MGLGIVLGVIKGNTGSLDCGPCGACVAAWASFWLWGLGLMV